MAEPFMPSEKIEWVESGIRLALTDTLLRNVEIHLEFLQGPGWQKKESE